jgi:hypothetical protein
MGPACAKPGVSGSLLEQLFVPWESLIRGRRIGQAGRFLTSKACKSKAHGEAEPNRGGRCGFISEARAELVKKSMGAAGIGFLFSVRKKSSRLAYSRLSARS